MLTFEQTILMICIGQCSFELTSVVYVEHSEGYEYTVKKMRWMVKMMK